MQQDTIKTCPGKKLQEGLRSRNQGDQKLQSTQPQNHTGKKQVGSEKSSAAHVRQLVQCNDAFICDIPAGNDLQLEETLLEILGLAEPLQTLVLYVNALLQRDLCNVFKTICKDKNEYLLQNARNKPCWLLNSHSPI